jgi:hypothetical protein
MPSITETAQVRTPYGALNAEGEAVISFDQVITFELYVRLVLPLDGFVYWIKAAALSDSALMNSGMGMNSAVLNQTQRLAPATSFSAKGTLHYETSGEQTVEKNYARNRVIFTALEPIQDLNSVGDNLLYIARFDAPGPSASQAPASTTEIRFAFQGRGSYFQQMNLWHYYGDSVYPTMASQIVDDPRSLSTTRLIVSNSLPFWLNFNLYNPLWPVPVSRPNVPLFPAMLSPDNMKTAYGAVDVETTEGVQSAPLLTLRTNHYQQAKDTVKLVMYGADNDVCQDFLDSFLQYSYDTELFGIMNIPIFRDEKEGQTEFSTLAKKKSALFEISYNQAAVRDVARQLILSCIPTVTGAGFVVNVSINP